MKLGSLPLRTKLGSNGFGIRILAGLGILDLLSNSAAGGIKKNFPPGDFMVLTDYVNLVGANLWQGSAFTGLNRFVNLTDT